MLFILIEYAKGAFTRIAQALRKVVPPCNHSVAPFKARTARLNVLVAYCCSGAAICSSSAFPVQFP